MITIKQKLLNRLEQGGDPKQAIQEYLDSLYKEVLEKYRLTKDPINIWCLQGDLNRVQEFKEIFK